MPEFTTFNIPSNSPGGFLNVRGVDRSFGFLFNMSPSVATQIGFLGFLDADTFQIRLSDVVTNMRINLRELPGVTPTFESQGIMFDHLESNLPNPKPSG